MWMQTKTRSDRRVAIGHEPFDMCVFLVPSNCWHFTLAFTDVPETHRGRPLAIYWCLWYLIICKLNVTTCQYHHIQRLNNPSLHGETCSAASLTQRLSSKQHCVTRRCHWDSSRLSKHFGCYWAGIACYLCQYPLDCRWDDTKLSWVALLLSSQTVIRKSPYAAESS